ncbi:MAG: quinone oxidoreductase [Candidatus Latescibacteria bacterium]|nr:quinone oxidoreductase [Candidatus Latescibacterota bacterium]
MKAIQVDRAGGPEVLLYKDVPNPEPAPGEVLVRINAIGLNYIDTYHRTGLYPLDLPFIPGLEAAGTVAALGTDATDFRLGDLVAYAGVPGSYAEFVAAPQERLVRLPDGVDAAAGAAAMLQGMTSHYLVHSTCNVLEGDTVLIHAAAGGVGLILVQMAKMRGAQVIGTVSTEEKAQLARGAGADEIIRYTEQDFEAEVNRLTDGQGVHVAYDSVGKTTWEKSLNCLRPRGYLVLFGNASGPVPPVDPLLLSRHGSIFMTRPTLVDYTATREELQGRAGELLGWIQTGKLSLRIDRTLPLSDAREAHRLLEGRRTKGKVLLIP